MRLTPTLTRAIRCRDSGDEGLGQSGADPVGDSDRLFPMTHARRLAETFPHARLHTINDSSTYVMLDQPARQPARSVNSWQVQSGDNKHHYVAAR
ncbi:alpha/beta hydrolase fold domain protein [Mycobacterium xenopi 4042]|uniref:Alpha/beta hydrolase fold domain protein n=1 Tax=Mycobacterium xenopi 4042 TaxID=1299334 RepID=X8AIQ7_MYCXE|nr:alpha/beta hydrolase fold domain protein [Mycobacterium xenopi 4042]